MTESREERAEREGDYISETIINLKGDLIVGTGPSDTATHPVGTNGQILAADSSSPTGIRWVVPPVAQDGTVDISGKADITYVDAQDATKADKTYVDSQDTLKADKTYVDEQDALLVSKGDLVLNVVDYGADPSGVADSTITIRAAVDAAAPYGAVVYFPTGNYKVSEAILASNGFTVRGASKGGAVITSSHAGPVFTSKLPDSRTYNWTVTDIRFMGPGKATVGSCALDMPSVSTSHIERVQINNYDRGIRIRSSINGGAVYNRMIGISAASCGRGFSIEAAGSNANPIFLSRVASCDTGVHIEDSNQCSISLSEIEGCTIGVYIHATAAALADFNTIMDTRFEGNTTAWQATANVRMLHVINPRPFGAYVVSDAGDRTVRIGAADASIMKSAIQSSAGAFQYVRTSNGGAELPAMVVRDTATTAGTPVTLQIETERTPGYPLRITRAGVNYLDIDSSGNIRSPQGGYIELTERADPATPPTANAGRLYLKDNGAGKTQVAVKVSSGAVIILGTEA